MSRKRLDHEWENRKDKVWQPVDNAPKPKKAKKGSVEDLMLRLTKALKREEFAEIARINSRLLDISPSFRGSTLNRKSERVILSSGLK